jgi:hypothetical protein
VDFTTGTNPYSVAIGDLDADGKPDLAAANYTSTTVSVFRNMASSGSIASGSFATKVDFTTGTNPHSVAIGDLDRDGKADLVVTNFGTTTVSVLRNTDCSNPTSGGTIAAAQSGFNTIDPDAFTSSAAASGHNAGSTLEYKWQSSTTSSSTGFSDIAGSNITTYDAGTITQTTWYKRLARASCLAGWTGAAESNVLEVTVVSSATWNGSVSTNWNTAANWTPNAVPAVGQPVDIPSGLTNYPALPSDRTLTSLSLASGASLNLSSNNLTLTSNLSNAGGITGAGKLTLAGSSAQSISGSGTISNLEVNNSAGVIITSGAGNMQTITGKLTPTTGTLMTNGNLTLRSSATGTARVGEGSASGGYISGDVITQRYLSKLTGSGRNGRAWRLVTIPVTGTGTLRDVFMAGQPGTDLTVPANRSTQPNDLGTVVIGHNQPDAATANGLGYDWIGTAGQVSSLRYYQPNATSGSFASSQVPTLTTTYTDANQGYMLFARGDRQQAYQGTGNSSATVLQVTGALKQGTIHVTIPALASAGFVLVGNPYMALLDLEKVILDNVGVIDNTVYVWDANIDGNSFRQGGYRAVTRTGASNWIASGAGANPQYIESGSAFFVKPTATGGTLSIKESHKVDGTPGIAPHSSMTEGPSRLFINLEVTDTANRRLVDGAVAFFDINYKDGLGDAVDIAPMTNLTAGSITLRQSGVRLSMEGRPWPADSAARTLPVDMRNLGDDAYVLRILPTNMNKEGFTARLKDRHLNQETSLKTDDETLYPFRRTGDPGIDSSRFEIVYRLSKPTNAGTLTPDDAAGEMAPRLYPNPARGADVKLSLGSLAPGRYDVQVLDISGRLVLKKTVDHQSSIVVHSIFGKVKPASGLYNIIVTEPKNQIKETLRLVVE